MENSIPATVTCLLCHGLVIYRDGDKIRFREHMRNEHGAFYDLDFLLASSLMAADQKESVARSVKISSQYVAGESQTNELERSDVGLEGEEEETLKENTNYDKDDQTNQPEYSEQPKMKMKKKPGRKKAVKVVGEDSVTVSTKQEKAKQKKAQGILGPRAAKRQRISVSTEDSPGPALPETSQSDPADQQTEAEVFNESSASSSFLTDTSLMDEDVMEDSEGQEENTPEQDLQSGVQSLAQVDLSSSKYFVKNPKMIANCRGSTRKLFLVNPVLPEGWGQRMLEVTSKKGDKLTSKHYLSPEMKVLRSGMAVVEYLRMKGELDLDQLKQLAKDLNVAEKKFQSLFSD